MPYPGYNHKPAIRHCRSHRPEIVWLNPAVPLTPQHQVGMPDIRHAALEFPACPLAREIDRCPDPDPFGDAKGLLQNPLEQRLNFRKPFAEARNATASRKGERLSTAAPDELADSVM